MRRALYGQRSERGQLLIDKLELGLEGLEESAGEDEALGARVAVGTNVEAFTRARPSRKPLPAHLPRERVVVRAPASCACCGSDRLSKLGEGFVVPDPGDEARLGECIANTTGPLEGRQETAAVITALLRRQMRLSEPEKSSAMAQPTDNAERFDCRP